MSWFASVTRHSLLGILVTSAAVGYVGGSFVARAGHTIGGGNCWQSSAPELCRAYWPGQNQAFNLQMLDRFSDGEPGWPLKMQDAVNAWHNAVGPQRLHWQHQPNDTNDYLWDAQQGTHGLVENVLGNTFNCRYTSGTCTSAAVPFVIAWSDVYFNKQELAESMWSDPFDRNTFAHEIGHTLGLFHHGNALMNAAPTGIQGPQADDIGANPPCSAGADLDGIRCIYRWSLSN